MPPRCPFRTKEFNPPALGSGANSSCLGTVFYGRELPHPKSQPFSRGNLHNIKAHAPHPNSGKLCRASLAPELPMGLNEAFAGTALHPNFSFCPTLLPSLPLGVDPRSTPRRTACVQISMPQPTSWGT